MKDTVDEIYYNGYTINIYSDDDPFNPREDCDNVCKMICFHRRYSLGDVKESNKWDSDDFQEFIEKENGKSIVALPLYLYDHSGITMSTGRFSCQWDSGCVGYAYIDKKEFIKEFGKKRWTKELQEKAIDWIKSDVEVYDDYISGQVYGYRIENSDEEEEDDYGCNGWFGYDFEKSGLLPEARAQIDWLIEERIKEAIRDTEEQKQIHNNLQPIEIY
jgi:hypothetical protein